MKIVFIVFAILFVLLAIPFTMGAIAASNQGSDKKRRAKALFSLSQMTEEQRAVLMNIFISYKNGGVNQANKVCQQASISTVNFLIDFFNYDNRPIKYSSGAIGQFTFVNFKNKLKKLGYSEDVSKIIPGVIIDNYNEVLEKMPYSATRLQNI